MFKPKTTTTSPNKQKNPELTMEDYVATTKSLVHHGCRLARDLESDIDDMFNRAGEAANICAQIAKIFASAGERLRGQDHSSHAASLPDPPIQATQASIDASLHEWLMKSNCFTQGIDVLQPASLQGTSTGQLAMNLLASASRSATSSSSSQRSRRRRDDAETRIVTMAAPQIGNTEIPPDDGYTWRKYGQKEIMGKIYPRAYYRCTHQKQFNCPAKKQVQRDDRDPLTFEVMYRGRHTCHLSATAPSTLPSQSVVMSQSQDNMPSHDHHHQYLAPAYSTSIASSSSAAALGSWLSIHAGAGGGATGSAAAAGASSSVVLEFPVVDMADVMFNSGSSSTSNSMDFLFPAVDDHHKRDNVGNKKMSD